MYRPHAVPSGVKDVYPNSKLEHQASPLLAPYTVCAFPKAWLQSRYTTFAIATGNYRAIQTRDRCTIQKRKLNLIFQVVFALEQMGLVGLVQWFGISTIRGWCKHMLILHAFLPDPH